MSEVGQGQSQEKFFFFLRSDGRADGRRRTANKKRSKNFVLGSPKKAISRFYSSGIGEAGDIYRQSPVKLPDIKNIIVVTLTFLFESSPLH